MRENCRLPGRAHLTVRRGDRLADEAGVEAGHAVAALPAGVVRRDRLPDTGPVVGGAAGPAAPEHVALLLAHLTMIMM